MLSIIKNAQDLDLFEKQKYKNLYQEATVPTSPLYSDEATQNSINEKVIYDEVSAYDPDPYLNDSINTQTEINYPNPYL